MTTEINTDMGVILETLNGKVDVDMNNAVPDKPFKKSTINWAMPDYKAAIPLSSGMKAPEDGELTIAVNGGLYATSVAYIDGVRVAASIHTGGTQGNQDQTVTTGIKIAKGQVVTSSGGVGFIFYPYKGDVA